MYWDGKQHHIFASEGGHTDFAPRDELEADLLQYLHGKCGHVSYERIVSGPGLVNVFRFLRDTGRGKEQQWLTDEMQRGDPAAAISRAALERRDPLSEQALDVFVSIYGAEAGNLALKALALGGVFVGGGIAPRMLPALTRGGFVRAFFDKGRLSPVLTRIPLAVVLDSRTALWGAAARANGAAA
jgi:glucokinase